jgi:hypothetical protein
VLILSCFTRSAKQCIFEGRQGKYTVMAVQPKPGECVYASENKWRFFLSYEGGQYHTVDVIRGYNDYAYYWRVATTLQMRESSTGRPRHIPGFTRSLCLIRSSTIPAISWDEHGTATANVEQLEALHLRSDVLEVYWTDGPGGMGYVSDTRISWDEPHFDSPDQTQRSGQKWRQIHREGYPAVITGFNLNKLADYTVAECGPAPSKDGTPVNVRSIRYYCHGLEHRDDGPSYTGSNCTCSADKGNCTRVLEWRQHGENRIDRPFHVSCDMQAWVSRDNRPATVHRNGSLVWSLSSVPERYTFWVHSSYALPVRLRFRAIAASSSVPGLANLVTWWVDE